MLCVRMNIAISLVNMFRMVSTSSYVAMVRGVGLEKTRLVVLTSTHLVLHHNVLKLIPPSYIGDHFKVNTENTAVVFS